MRRILQIGMTFEGKASSRDESEHAGSHINFALQMSPCNFIYFVTSYLFRFILDIVGFQVLMFCC